MGVPKFFRWISERYPKINQTIECQPNPETRGKYFYPDQTPIPPNHHQNNLQDHVDSNSNVNEMLDPSIPEFDRLYIDMNGIIHGCSHNNSTDQQDSDTNTNTNSNDNDTNSNNNANNKNGITEEQIFANISYYLDRVVSDIVKPKEMIYMAIDGVAPRAKMNQQRSRRFRSGKESEIAHIHKQNIEKQKQKQMQKQIENHDDDDDDDDDNFMTEEGMYKDSIKDFEDLQKGSITMEMSMDGNDLVTTSSGGFAGTIQTGKLKQSQKHNNNNNNNNNNTNPPDDIIYSESRNKKQFSPQQDKHDHKDDNNNDNDDDDIEAKFHHNSITPGTPFLDRCATHIQNFIRHKMTSGDPKWKDLKIIFSGPNVPGEGEHKIMDFIRKEQNMESNNSQFDCKRHCLMGQDGDLIMLGLATHELNFCLLREKVYFGAQSNPPPLSSSSSSSSDNINMNSVQNSIQQYTNNSHFQLLHVNILRDYIAYEFETKDVVPESPFELEPTIDDFVFMTFFVGNDFLPHMPALDIGDGAFDLLFQKYKKHRNGWIRDYEKKKYKNSRQKRKGKGRNHHHHNNDNSHDNNYPYFTRSGEIVDGKRLENYLMDVGRHEDPYYDWKKRSEDKTYEHIRRSDIKHGREFSVPSKEERELVEQENRQKYKEMLENIALQAAHEASHEQPQHQQQKQQQKHQQQKPSSSSLPVMTSKSLPTIKFIPQADKEEEEDGFFAQFARLVSDSLSPSSRNTSTTKSSSFSSSDTDTAQYELEDHDMTDLKGRYYYDKFHFTPLDIQKHQALRKAYIEGLVWNLKYYYQGCISWDWYYPYHYGPMLSDLTNLSSVLKRITFEKGTPLRPFEQLLACMPPNSAHVLPKPYRFLMTDHKKSPIVDFYPEDFVVDMNGKHYPWEAVVLLPFIDAKKLVTAVEDLVDTDRLTEDERKRNEFGKSCVMFLEEVDGSKTLKEIMMEEEEDHDEPSTDANFTIPSHLTEKQGEEHTNASTGTSSSTIDYLRPGFTTLRTVPISGMEKKKIGLNIFGTKSRYQTSVLNMDDAFSYSVLPPASMLGKKFIGTTVHFQYPYFREGFVTAVSDSNGSIRGKTPYRPWQNDAEKTEWRRISNSLHRQYEYGDGTVGSGGWHLPSKGIEMSEGGSEHSEEDELDKLLITLRPLAGLQRLENGEIVKVYDKQEIHVPFLATLWSPHQKDPRLDGIRARLEKNPFKVNTDTAAFVKKGDYRRNNSENMNGFENPPRAPGLGSSLPILPPINSDKLSIGNSLNSLPPLGKSKHMFSTLSANPNNNEAISTLLSRSGIPSIVASTKYMKSLAPIPAGGNKKNYSTYTLKQSNLRAQQKLASPTPRKTSSYHSMSRMKGRVAVTALVASSLFTCGSSTWNHFADAASVSPPKPWRLHQTSYGCSSLTLLRGGDFSVDNDDDNNIDDNNEHGHNNELTDFQKKTSPPPLEFAHGTTTLSFIFQGGIIAAVDSRASMGNFVGSKTTQKVLPINKHILGTMAGGAADCTFWIRKLQSYATLHSLSTRHSITVARASRMLSDFLYQNRHLDLSVGTMIMGFDARGASIYYVDNTGLRIGGDLFAVGSGSTFALGILDTVSREDRWSMSEQEAIELGIRAIRHATFRDAFSGGYIGVYLITKAGGWKKVFSEDLASISE